MAIDRDADRPDRCRVPRIGSVLLGYRPSFSGTPQTEPRDFEGQLHRLRLVWNQCAQSTGIVRFKSADSGKMVPVATVWRLPGEDVPRVATAGHALMALITQGQYVPPTGFDLFDVDVVFGSGGLTADATEVFAVTRVLMAHARCDFCVLELDKSRAHLLPPPLEIVMPQAAGDQPGLTSDMRIAVIGYPSVSKAGLFGNIWDRHLSPGLVRRGSAAAAALANAADAEATLRALQDDTPDSADAMHDASTCAGFSGAPVIDLDSGKVVALHIAGSEGIIDPPSGVDDWNDMVDLCALQAEDWVAAALSDGDVGGLGPLNDNWVLAWDSMRAGEGAVRDAVALAERLRRMRPGHLGSGIAPDRPDFRDRPFVPSLARPEPRVDVRGRVTIGDQRGAANCAAHALAAALEPQLTREPADGSGPLVSVAMLDALARDYDEFLDDTIEGTSLRGMLKGFFQNGVCRASLPGAVPGEGESFLLTRTMAKNARKIRLGAYFRVAPDLSDMQMAVQETRGVLVSAHIHRGWTPPGPYSPTAPAPVKGIAFGDLKSHPRTGAHAFLVTGYDEEGFIIQNSWGAGWGEWGGHKGHARWSYADWAANVIDAWVVRLAAPTPSGFGLIAAAGSSANALPAPRRAQLLGHMIYTERDWIVEQGTFGLGLRAIGETVRFLAGGADQSAEDRKAARKYRRLALVFHDPTLGTDMIARIAARMTPEMKAQATYAIHLCHGLDEIRTLTLRLTADAQQVEEGFAKSLAPPWRYLERRVAVVSQRLVESYRQGAGHAVAGPLGQALTPLLSGAVLDPSATLPKGRQLAVLAAGLGAVPALACAGLIGARAQTVFLAPPVYLAPASTVWRLGPEQRSKAIPGYPGEWVDLLAAALGEDARPRGARAARGNPAGRWGDIGSALLDPRLIADLCK